MERTKRPKLQRHILYLVGIITLLILAGLMLSLLGSRNTSRSVYSLMENFYSVDGYIDAFEQCERLLYSYRWEADLNEDKQAGYEDDLESCLSWMRIYLNQMQARTTIHELQVYHDCRALSNMYPHYAGYVEEFCTLMAEGRRSEAIQVYYAREVLATMIQRHASATLRDTVQSGQGAYLRAEQVSSWLWYGQLAVGLGALGISVYFAFALWQILMPVGSLVEASEALQSQNFDIPDVHSPTRNREMLRLVDAFNHMKNATHRLVTTLKEHNKTLELLRQTEARMLESQRLAEQAKLSSLRSQINPHFLFNTLNTIRRVAQLEKAPKTEQLILSLAKIFRHSLRSKDGPVPLEDEIAATQQYYLIQNTRFGERVELHWAIDPACEPESLLVPPMILQPLVENAIRHGLEPKPEGGCIEISVAQQGEMLCLSVADNGCGMNEETLRYVRAGEKPPAAEHGIGLSNVYKRLHILDERNQMLIESTPGRGTRITMRLPVCYADDTEEE